MVCLWGLWLPHLSCSSLRKTGAASPGKVAGHMPAHPPVTRQRLCHHLLPAGAVYSQGSLKPWVLSAWLCGLQCVVEASVLSLPQVVTRLIRLLGEKILGSLSRELRQVRAQAWHPGSRPPRLEPLPTLKLPSRSVR